MPEKTKRLNNTNDNTPLENNNEPNNSLKSNFPIKEILLVLGIIIILLSSFFISAIIASKNYEGIFNYIKSYI